METTTGYDDSIRVAYISPDEQSRNRVKYYFELSGHDPICLFHPDELQFLKEHESSLDVIIFDSDDAQSEWNRALTKNKPLYDDAIYVVYSNNISMVEQMQLMGFPALFKIAQENVLVDMVEGLYYYNMRGD